MTMETPPRRPPEQDASQPPSDGEQGEARGAPAPGGSGRGSSPDAEAASGRLYRLLVESVQDYAIFALDPAGRVLTWSAGAARLKGYTRTEIIGRHFSAFYPGEDVAAGKPERELEAAARSGRVQDEGGLGRKDGAP